MLTIKDTGVYDKLNAVYFLMRGTEISLNREPRNYRSAQKSTLFRFAKKNYIKKI